MGCFISNATQSNESWVGSNGNSDRANGARVFCSAEQEDWPNQIEWMRSTLEGFNKTFGPRVKSLDASEWQPADDRTDD